MYSIKQLSTICKVSAQSIYNLKRKNQAFSSICQANSQRIGKEIRYNQPVLDWLIDYYSVAENDVGEDFSEEQKADSPIQSPADEIAELREKLLSVEKEKQMLLEQNSQLLLLLQEEKQEKMLLLNPPRKSFKEKLSCIRAEIISIFKHSEDKEV